MNEAIDNFQSTSRVIVKGQNWTARTKDQTIIPENTTVTVVEVSGVKLIVSMKEEN